MSLPIAKLRALLNGKHETSIKKGFCFKLSFESALNRKQNFFKMSKISQSFKDLFIVTHLFARILGRLSKTMFHPRRLRTKSNLQNC